MTHTYQSIDYYLGLAWTYTVKTAQTDDGQLYIVCVNELPGICTDAPTCDEAMREIKQAMSAAFQLYMDNGEKIPEPTP